MDICRRRWLLRTGGLAAATLAGPLGAQAQAVANWPNRAVKIIVPNVPGGALDITARLLESELTKLWKVPIIIEYKPGAGSITGTDILAKSAPDGYTLGILAVGTLGIQPALRQLPFEPLRDLSGSLLVVGNIVLVSTPGLPFRDLKGLIAYGKASKDELLYATAGAGSSMHLAGEQLKLLTGMKMQHIAYKGSGAAYPDVMGGRVPLMVDPLFSAMPHIKSGKLVPIAMMGLHRDPAAPNIPAAAEVFPDFDFASNIGFGMPRATPPELAAKIHGDVQKIIRSEALAPKLREMGLVVTGSTPSGFDQYMRKSTKYFADVVKNAGVTID